MRTKSRGASLSLTLTRRVIKGGRIDLAGPSHSRHGAGRPQVCDWACACARTSSTVTRTRMVSVPPPIRLPRTGAASR